MALSERFARRLALPLIAAPMLTVSNRDLVIAACRAGVIGAFPTANCRSLGELDEWLAEFRSALSATDAPFCANLIIRRPDLQQHLERLCLHRVEMVITSVGSPAAVIEPLHAIGALVFADVATLAHARKAVAAGADGLVLLTAGAGGQTGSLNGFAFVRAVRQFFDGPLVLAGGISDGTALWAATSLGCDLGYMGTRFIATRESAAPDAYKQMLVDSNIDDIVLSSAFTGLPTSMLSPSLQAAGDLSNPKKWRDLWSAGHSVSGVAEVLSVRELVDRTHNEFSQAAAKSAASPWLDRSTPAASDTFVGVKPVETTHRLDRHALERWLIANVRGYEGPLEILQFRGGQSNPTYKLLTPNRHYVLRKKPGGKLLPSAHAVDREFRVISALHATGFPVARPYALCMDDGVIGTAFYVMEMVEGRIIWDDLLPGVTVEHRRAIYEQLIATHAALHKLDYQALGLADFGKPGNYLARQVDRWSRQYRQSETERIEEMEALMRWLPQSIPPGDETCLVHGDYRLDNMVLHATLPKVLAVLDWELSTLGDPLADFTYSLLNWALPPGLRSKIGGIDPRPLGIPTLEEAVALYCRYSGRREIPHLDWYLGYNTFRLACIVQGIAGRVRDGTATSTHAVQMVSRMRELAVAAHQFARRAGLD